MTNTPIDRKSVERPCPNCGVTLNGHSGLRHCGTYISHDRSTCIRYLRAALDEAEAELHRWRQAAAKGSLHTQADLDCAVAEARAVALKKAAEVAAYEADFVPVKPDDFRKTILALIDTPAAEALERVQTEERAKGMERAGTILLDNPHWTRWHVLEVIRAEAAAIRARGET